MPGIKFVSADPTPCYVKDVKVSDQSRLVVTFAIAGNRDSSVVIEMSPEDAKALGGSNSITLPPRSPPPGIASRAMRLFAATAAFWSTDAVPTFSSPSDDVEYPDRLRRISWSLGDTAFRRRRPRLSRLENQWRELNSCGAMRIDLRGTGACRAGTIASVTNLF